MIKKRIISGLAGIALVLFVLWAGEFAFLLLAGAAALIGTSEYLDMWKPKGVNPISWLAYLGTFSFSLSAYYYSDQYFGAVVTGLILLGLALQVFTLLRYNIYDAVVSIFGVLYVGMMFSYLILLRQLPNPLVVLGLVFGGTWACDILAFFLGIRFGKRKLCPQISPNKTVEGALGGVIGSILVTAMIGLIAAVPARHFVPLGFLIAVAAQIGDLAESSLKRYVGIKDSGNIIPGHGGILDRCDSLIFVAPVVYYYIKIFTSLG